MTNTFRKVNITIVFDPSEKNVLMCLRQKNPYKGLFNFVGGKLEMNESNLDGAYRELFEETGISNSDIKIKPLFTTQYFEDNIELQVYYGTLLHDVELKPEKNPLFWISKEEDFADDLRFAGQGNIKHMIEMIHESKQQI